MVYVLCVLYLVEHREDLLPHVTGGDVVAGGQGSYGKGRVSMKNEEHPLMAPTAL